MINLVLHWIIASTVFGPILIGLPVLMLVVAIDELVLRTQHHWEKRTT